MSEHQKIAAKKITTRIFRQIQLAALAMFGALLLNGCVNMSKTERMATNGNYHALSKTASPQAYKKTKIADHYFMCMSLLKVQNFSRLDTCNILLKKRLLTEKFYWWGVTFNQAAGNAIVNNLDAQKYLELNQYKKAIDYGLIAQANLKNATTTGGMPGTSLASAGMFAFTIGIHGVLTIAYANTKKPNQAKEQVQLMRQRYSEMPKFDGVDYARWMEGWIAKGLFAIKDYKSTYEFMMKNHKSISDKIVGILMIAGGGRIFEGLEMKALGRSSINEREVIAGIQSAMMLYRSAFEIGKLNEARKGYDQLLQGDLIKNQPEIHFRVLQDRARLALKDNDQQLAEKLMKKAILTLESARKGMKTESYKLGFAGGRYSIYQDIVNLLMDQHRYDEAFAYAERGKARALVDMLASKKKFYGGNAINDSEQNKLLAQLDIAEAKARVMSDPKAHSTTRSIVIKKRSDLSLQAPELSSLVTVSAPDVKEIQSLLPENETLIEYYGSGDNLFAFVVTGDGIRGVKLNGTGLNADISAFREAILDVTTPAYRQSGNKLYKRLIDPVAAGIHTKNLTIVPHGALHYLPFSALTTDHGFMLDKYNIRILPSASVMKFLKSHKNNAGSLLALGNPDLGDAKYDLPFAQKEAIKVSSEIPGSKLLLRSAATETAVKKYGKGFRYLHFASHGTFDAEKPLQSGLLLAKDNQNDGMLTVGELYDLNLNADLVTLSACETALGKIANGDDVVGFTRGFLYAGASSIVSSLWQVDDAATSDLMTSFYDNLAKEDKRSALRDAQLLTKSKYHHPYYWAAFQITGAVQ